jgi:uncharacterized tellurite resistance protein B-like protein
MRPAPPNWMPMFENLLNFLTEMPGHSRQAKLSTDDPRVAAAALMFHVMDADGVRRETERKRLKQLLAEAYGLSGRELDRLLEAGEDADQEAIDLYAFTSVLKRHLNHQGRTEFIRIMWEIVYADGERHELEDNVVWRVAELIGVDSRERIAMRQLVRKDIPDAGEMD